jgi:hypothetical protein
MPREFDLFEKFPDGSSLWRDCVLGRENARLRLQKLAQKSEHQFYAIDIVAGKTLHLHLHHNAPRFRPPGKSGRPSSQQVA